MTSKRSKLTWLQRLNLKVASVLPGLKTKITVGLGSLGSIAAVLQQYMGGLPLDRIATPTQILIITTILFSLAFWFKDLSKYNVGDVS